MNANNFDEEHEHADGAIVDKMKRGKQAACGVPWCIALISDGRSSQFCRVHEDKSLRTISPPPVSRELEKRFEEATRKDL